MANREALFEMQISTLNVKIVCGQLEKYQSYVVPFQYTVERIYPSEFLLLNK